MPLYTRIRSRDCRSDFGYGSEMDSSMHRSGGGGSFFFSRPTPKKYHNTYNNNVRDLDTSFRSAYGRSTFGPGCGDYEYDKPRMNVTINDPHGIARLPSAPLFKGETCAGYGIDALPSSKTPKRHSRVREVLKELLLGSRSRRREKKEAKELLKAAPRACSLTLPPRRSRSPPRHSSVHRTPTYGGGKENFKGYEKFIIDEPQEPRRPTSISWVDEGRRRRRRESKDWSYIRTPSADTVLMESPPLDDGVRWMSGEDLRRGHQEPKRKKKRETFGGKEGRRPQEGGVQAMRVKTYDAATPQRVQYCTATESRRARRREREDAFVNSHEWTLSRAVSELHLGIIGTSASGKTALVHRYLTGSYQSDESPEGGRFKKEVVAEGQSHLLLIRDEGIATPDAQFTLWADAVLLVYAVDVAETFERLQHLYHLMCDYRSLSDVPMIIVGTKDSVSESSPRVVSEEQGKRLATKLRCAYFETNASYGANVERVFKEACHKMLYARRASIAGAAVRSSTPTEKYAPDARLSSMYAPGYSSTASSTKSGAGYYGSHHQRSVSAVPMHEQQQQQGRKSHIYGTTSARGGMPPPQPFGTVPSASFASRASQMDPPRGISPSSSSQKSLSSNGAYSRSSAALLENGMMVHHHNHPSGMTASGVIVGPDASASTSHLPTPSSTPTTQRKNRRISNIFRPGKDHHEDKAARVSHEVNMGVGRSIPVMQGQLYKRSGGKSALNRGDWKKKFVTLTNDGKLTYHQTIKDYMENVTGKEVFLGTATVRIPGRQRTRNSQVASMASIGGGETEGTASPSSSSTNNNCHRTTPGEPSGEGTSGGGSDEGGAPPSTRQSGHQSIASTVPLTPQTVANPKKRRGHSRRLVGGGKGGDDDEECFEIVTCDQKRWEFCASSVEEREEWVKAIEAQIDAALQQQLSQPSNQQRVLGAKTEVTALLSIPGNDRCADCGALRPEWASLNLGTAICMECSGLHRNLGSHISKVRSLKFDDWPLEYLAVMRSLGNTAANRIWEANCPQEEKLRVDASTDERDAFIRAKYVAKKYLAPLPDQHAPISSQLIGAVVAADVSTLCLLLARATPADVNHPVSATDRRTALHLACSNTNVQIVQMLLWNGCDPKVLDSAGHSALWHAQNSDAKDCAAVLVAAGLPPDFGLGNEPQVIMGSLSTRDYSDSTRRQVVGNV